MDSSFQVLLTKLAAKWRSNGIAYNLGITGEELRLVEQAVAFQFDESFRAYLYQMNGCVEFEWDKDLFCFWSTTRIIRELADHPADLICFADYSINAGSFGFQRTQPDPCIYLHFQTVPGRWVVADSFADFLSIYLANPNSLLR
jgi:hypothetical protein